MNKASASIVVFIFASLLVSFQSFGQRREVLNEQVGETLRIYEKMRLSELLRLSSQEARRLKLLSLMIKAQGLQGQAQLELLVHGQFASHSQVKRQIKDIRFQLPPNARIEDIEFASKEEIYIESVSVEVERENLGTGPRPLPRPEPQARQVSSGQLVSIELNQPVYQMARLDLEQLLLKHSGLTLKGAEIERVIVDGDPSYYARAASFQLELNGRPVGPIKTLSSAQRKQPIIVQSIEEVRQGLSIVVHGDAIIYSIQIRVGQVRAQIPQRPQPQRVYVGKEISSSEDLELATVFPFERRQVESIVLEAQARFAHAEVALSSYYGGILGSVIVNQIPMRAVIKLMRPMSVQDLRLQSFSKVRIESIELEFASSYPY